MFVCAHVYDVALCGNTVRNVALDLWLVGHHCYIKREVYTHYLNSWAFVNPFDLDVQNALSSLKLPCLLVCWQKKHWWAP